MASMRYRPLRPSLAAVVFAVWPFAPGAGAQSPAPPSQPPAQKPAGPLPSGQKPADQKLPPEIARAAKVFDQALKDQQAGRNAKAIAGYQEVIRLAPNVYPAHMNLGLLYRAEGKWSQAEQSLKRAAALDPKNALPPIQLAHVLLAQQRVADAKAQALKAVALDARSAQAHQVLGAAYAGLKDAAGAEKAYRQACKLAPGNAQYLFAWATTLGILKKNDESLAALDRALKLDPKLFQAHMYRGVLLQQEKDYRGAIASYKRASAVEPREAAPWFNMGLCWQFLARDSKNPASDITTQEAISAYLKAIELAPNYVPAHLNIARLYYAVGNYRQAARYFSRAAELDPTNTRIIADAASTEFWISQTSREQKEKDEFRKKAETRLTQALQKNPDEYLWGGLGNIYMQSAQLGKAEEVFRQWTVKRPKQSGAWMSLAKAMEAQKKPLDAQAAYEKALGADPKNVDARTALATLLESQNKPDAAIAQYRQILAQNGKNSEVRRKLGQIYLRQNKTAEALAQFEEMKKLSPKETAPYIAIATTYEKEKKPEEALREYRAMAAMNPKDSTSRWYVARALEGLKRYDEALAEFRAIEKIAPMDTFYVTNIPRLLELAGKKEEALAEYKRLADRDPKNVQFRAMYAGALSKEGRHGEAIKEYEAILEQSSNATWVHVRIGDAYREQKRWDDARAAYKKALDQPSSATEAFGRIETSYLAEGKNDGWYAFLKEWMEKHPTDRVALAKIEAAAVKAEALPALFDFLKPVAEKSKRDALFQLDYASLLVRHNRKDEATAAYRAAVELREQDYTTRVTLANLYEQTGRLPDAIGMYEQITNMKTIPPSQLAGFRVKLATLYEKNGQSQLALTQYRQALAGDPNNAAAAEAVKRLGG